MSSPDFFHRPSIEQRWPLIAGAGPKPETPKVETQEAEEPEEEEDSLVSHSFARVIDLICEGEIEGLCSRSGRTIETRSRFGLGIYLDETPLLNNNGTPNFRGIITGMQYGTQDQTAIPGFGKAEDVVFIGQAVKVGFPISQAITNPDAETIEVAIRIPSLMEQEDNGDIKGTSVAYQVAISLNGGGFVNQPGRAVYGKASSPYIHTSSYVLPRSLTPENDNWTVRVTRLTADSSTIRLSNSTIFDFITIVTRNQFRYPNSAIVATEIDASGMNSVPTRGYHVKGLLVKVPSNYFPGDRDNPPTYNRDPLTGDPIVDLEGEPITQPWDGTFYTAWTSNPAWCLYDFITNSRYGTGEYTPASRVDKWSFYDIGQYCDELVDDGFGNLEPRFVCNAYIQGREEAWKVIQDFCSIFHGMPFWANGVIQIAIDRPADPIATFTNANVIDGLFTYSGTSKKARHTTAAVRWNDPKDFYRSKFEYVDDPTAVALYGVNEITVAAFGCTSRGQAHRMGKWLILTELYLTDTVQFQTGTDGAYLLPGDIIAVIDNQRNMISQGGRLTAIGDSNVVLDRDVAIVAGDNYVSIQRPRANLTPGEVTTSSDIDELRTAQFDRYLLSNGVGTTNNLTIAGSFPADLAVGAIWLLENDTQAVATYRVLAVEEISAGEKYQVIAIQYRKDKFDAIDFGIELEELDQDTNPLPNSAQIPHVNGLTLTRRAVVSPEGVTLLIDAAWSAPEGVLVEIFKVEYRRQGESDNWKLHEETSRPLSTIEYFVPGTYEVGVTVIATNGERSEKVIAQILIDFENPIEAYFVSGLALQEQPNEDQFYGRDARFEWRLNSPNTNQEIGSENLGANEGTADPYFKDFLIQIWNAADTQLLYEETTTELFFTFLWEKNALTPGGPHNQFRIKVYGRDKYNATTEPAMLLVTNAVPAPPTALGALSSFRTVMLSWVSPAEIDIEAIEIYRNTVDNFATASKIAEVPPATTSFVDSGISSATTYRYWIRARDTFGNLSLREPSGAGLAVTPGQVQNTDIADFAVTASKHFLKVVILHADVWTNNSNNGVGGSSPGSIHWNAHTLYYNGTGYAIPAGNTALAYVYWDPANPGNYLTSATNPLSLANGTTFFQIATNTAGIHDLAWNELANAVIGTAHIQNLAVTDAKIANLAVEKLLAGTILAQIFSIAANGTGGVTAIAVVAGGTGYSSAPAVTLEGGGGAGATATASVAGGAITGFTVTNAGAGYTEPPTVVIGGPGTGGTGRASITNGVEGSIQSTGFLAGLAGWKISGSGNAEFNDVVVRGILDAALIYNNSLVANKAYPTNYLQGMISAHSGAAFHDFLWNGGSGNTTMYYGAAGVGARWDGTAYTGGTNNTKDLTISGSFRIFFAGMGVADTASFGGITKQKRIGTDQEVQFTFVALGTRQTASGFLQLLHRVYPASGGTPGDSSSTYPFICGTYTTRVGTVSQNDILTGILRIAIPADHILEFCLAPVNTTGDSNSTWDRLDDMYLTIWAGNP